MKGFSTVNVRQYLPEDRSGDLRQKFTSEDTESQIICNDLSKVSTLNQTHYQIIQNPTSIRDGLETDDGENWSDSPTNQPSLDDSLRYSYGRFGTRYGSLDGYSGAIIRTRNFLVSNDGATRAKFFSGEKKINHLRHDSTGWSTIKKLSLPTNEVTINTYNIFTYASPPMFSYKNPVSTDVSIRLANFINNIDSTSIALTLNGESKTVSTTPFVGGLGGVDATWTNDTYFNYNEQVDVVWTFTDDAIPVNLFTISYWFRTVKDHIGPRISSISPADDATNTSVGTCIQFDVRDFEIGVSLDSFELYVNNVRVINSDITFSELSTGDGYSVSFCPAENFLYGDEIPVSVYVEDSSDDSNYLFHVYSFTTESSLAPTFIDSSPVACRKYKPINVDVEVDVVDGGHGLDEDSIILHVDGEAVVFRKLPIIYRGN